MCVCVFSISFSNEPIQWLLGAVTVLNCPWVHCFRFSTDDGSATSCVAVSHHRRCEMKFSHMTCCDRRNAGAQRKHRRTAKTACAWESLETWVLRKWMYRCRRRRTRNCRRWLLHHWSSFRMRARAYCGSPMKPVHAVRAHCAKLNKIKYNHYLSRWKKKIKNKRLQHFI